MGKRGQLQAKFQWGKPLGRLRNMSKAEHVGNADFDF